eukprot:TRINITY_DN71347_c0_g1_i1.p1 TRINITY_DN71347_c0_g1~~TRINITY_DN71347_c0_g1_i1.p1  ORF type:complete len:259 (-),score=46.89 TRINITY_DN71347_c0_g1_i1:81-857(-)
MEAANNAAESVATTLGVGFGAAQVIVWLAVLVIAYILLQVVQGAFGGALKTRRALGKSVLLFGQCGSGKTTLFFQLRDGEETSYVSSLKPHRDTFQIKTGSEDGDVIGPIEVIDFPGHQRLRTKAVALIKEGRCIVYVVDADDKQKLKDVAEHLYELLTQQDICELHTPILLAINKSDLSSARSDKFILDEIDREIEQMRVSRGATLEGQDQADSYLGVDGEKFKLLEHSPCPITTCRVSAKQQQLQPVYDFLREQFS